MSKKNKFIIVVGVVVVLMPLLGFPGSVRDTIIILAGFMLIGSAFWGAEWGKIVESFLGRHLTRHHSTFAENIPSSRENLQEVFRERGEKKKHTSPEIGDSVRATSMSGDGTAGE